MATTIQTIELPKKARALDTSGNNNHGQIYSGRGLEFDGVSDYLDLGAATVFSTGAWTTAFWVNIDAIGSQQNFLSTSTGASTKNIAITAAGVIGIYDWGGKGWQLFTAKPNINTWYRVVFVYDGSGNLTFYLNGEVTANSNTSTPGLTTSVDSLDIRYIGAEDGDAEFFGGKMSDVQLWDAAWTAADVTYDYLNPESLALNASGTSLTESNLKLWYPMQDGHRGQQSYILDGANTGKHVIATSDGGTYTGSNTSIYPKDSNDNNVAKVIGQAYEYTWTITEDGGGTGMKVFPESSTYVTDVGTYTETWVATGTTDLRIYLHGFTGAVSNVSVSAVNLKNHATTVFYGDDLISEVNDRNSIFDEAGQWAGYGSPTSAAIVGGKFQVETTGDSSSEGATLPIANLTAIVAGRTYRVAAKLDDVGTANADAAYKFSLGGTSVLITASDGSPTGGVIDTTEQEYYADITAANTTGDLIVQIPGGNNDAATTFTVDDVSVKEIGVASGWTDADQQLHIPQTALQSYNELGWFDGAADYITMDTDPLAGEAQGTISYWARTSSAAIMAILGYHRNQWSVRQDNDGMYLGVGTTESSQAYTDDLSNWGYFTITFNAGNITFYRNGVSIGTADVTGSVTAFPANTDGMFVGKRNNPTPYYFEGCVTEVSLFDTTLTVAQVQELYNDGKALDATTHSASSNLKGYWRNNGLTTWTDLSGEGNDGTPTSMTETLLLPAGVDSTRDNQGFIMNKEKDTSCLNLTNGFDDPYVWLGSTTAIPAGDAYSFVMWVKPDDVISNYLISDKVNNTDFLSIKTATLLEIRHEDQADLFTVSTLVAKDWVHIAFVRNTSNLVTVYINGEASVDTETAANIFDYQYIGARDPAEGFRGAMDGVLIYDSELSAAEVLRNYNATKGSHRN